MCRLELKLSQDKSICKFLIDFCVCVDDVVRLGGALQRVQIFILTEGLKIKFVWHYQLEKAVWYNFFVNLVNN